MILHSWMLLARQAYSTGNTSVSVSRVCESCFPNRFTTYPGAWRPLKAYRLPHVCCRGKCTAIDPWAYLCCGLPPPAPQPGVLNHRDLFLMILEAGNPRSRLAGEASFPGLSTIVSTLCPHTVLPACVSASCSPLLLRTQTG